MTISALPTAPNRNMTPEAFVAAADAWVAAMSTFASQVNADLNLILNLSGLLATSTTSVLIGTGSKSFTVETSKAYLAGQSVRVYSTASPANYMLGTVTSYDAGTGALVVNVTSVGGSGTLAAWTVVLAASGEWLGNATTATNLSGGTVTATSVASSGGLTSSNDSVGVGYTAGAGGTVTQTGAITSPVTLNKVCGEIVTVSHSFVSGTPVRFTLFNSKIDLFDNIIVNVDSGVALADVLISACTDSITNAAIINIYPLATLTTSIKVRFSVIKSSAS